MLLGGHLLALALVFHHEGAEARHFGRSYLKAQLKFRDLLPAPFGGCRLFLFSLLVTGARAEGMCRMHGSERGFERCDVAAMLPFFGEQRELAFFDSFLEFDEFRFSALAIRDLRIERLGQPVTLGLMLGLVLGGYCRELHSFNDGLFDLITCRPQTLFLACTVDLGTPDGALEPMRVGLIAEVEQQRVDTIGVVRERNPLNEHRPNVVLDDELGLDRGGALRPHSCREFLPLGEFGNDDAIRQISVQDGRELPDAEEAEPGIVAR
jgi:hypothetical protein